MKKLIKAILARLGIVAFKRSSRVYLPDDDAYRISAGLCANASPVIFDGGAHRGGSVEAFIRFLPQATFYCFEPDPTLVAELNAKFAGTPQVHVVGVALGAAAGTTTLNINFSRPTNSLLPAGHGLQPDLERLCQPVDQVEVPIVSLDAFCQDHAIRRIDILKLDLQGYDYIALQGARHMLATVGVVQVEVLFTKIYQGCHLFGDVLGLMREHGFVLYTLSGLHYGEHDELLWADAIFRRASDDA